MLGFAARMLLLLWSSLRISSPLPVPILVSPSFLAASRRALRWFFAALAALLMVRTGANAAAITAGTRYPTNEEQYTLQLINHARTSPDGLAILQTFVTNDVGAINASSTGTSGTGTKWAAGYWKSSIQGVADSMNYFQVSPGDLKKQFQDLSIPGTPLAWDPNLGNVSSGYNDIVIASQGSGAGFPHALSPYADQSTFDAYAKRYTDGGYGPLNMINTLGENIAPNFYAEPMSAFAGFMVDWGASGDGIQPQDPNEGSHRLNLMAGDFVETGVSRKSGWTAGNITEVQEFGRRFNAVPTLVGAVFTDSDSNGFYTPGEGLANVTIVAAPVGGGTSFQTTTYTSGGYALPIPTPGDYTVTFSNASGVLKTATVTIGSENILLDALLTGVVGPPPPPGSGVAYDFDGDGKPDLVLYNGTTHRTTILYMNGATRLAQVDGPILPVGWKLAGVADFNGDGHPDFLLYNSSNHKTQVWYLNGVTQIGTANGPTLPAGWTIAGVADFNADGKPDLLLFNSFKRLTMTWYLNGVTKLPGAPAGPAIPTGAVIVGVGDFNADGQNDLLLSYPSTHQSTVYYLNGPNKIGEAAGPVLAAGWTLKEVADMDGDGRPDLIDHASTGRKTEVRYMGGVVVTGTAAGPVLPAGSVLAAP